MESADLSAEARSLFSKFLETHAEAEAEEFEAFQALHPDRAGQLAFLFEEFHRLRALLDLPARSIAAHMREVYGADATKARAPGDRRVEIDTSELLAHLPERGSSDRRYRIRGEIARGGMGAILQVWDSDLRRDLAMKVALTNTATRPSTVADQLDPRSLARFLEEAQITGQLDHPGIVPVHELGLDSQGRVYFTMRLVRGRDFGHILRLLERGEERWTRTRVLGVVVKACETVAFAHSKGVIHRDIKPSNLMVGRFGEVYVMDWGLAKATGAASARDEELRRTQSATLSRLETLREEISGEDSSSPVFTLDGEVVGTPSYMSPEQADGHIEEMGTQSDVYSMGAILYRFLAGCRPYETSGLRQEAAQILNKVIEGPPKPLGEYDHGASVELVAICEKAMARRVGDRYASMEEMAEDLHAFLEGRVVAAFQSGPIAELRKWVGRNRAITAVVAASLLLVIGLLARNNVVQASANRQLTGVNRELTDMQNLALALGSRDLVAEQPVLGLLVAEELARQSPSYHSRNAVLSGLQRLFEDRHLDGLQGVSVEPTGDLVAGWTAPSHPDGGANGRLRIWHLANRSWLHEMDCALDGAKDERNQVFSPSGRRVASFADDGTVWVYDPLKGSLDALGVQGVAHASAVRSAVFQTDEILLTGGADGSLLVWDLARSSSEPTKRLSAHLGEVSEIELNVATGTMLTRSGGAADGARTDRWVRVWSVEDWRVLHEWAHPDEPYAANFDEVGEVVVTACRDGLVRFWDARDGEPHFSPIDVGTQCFDADFASWGARRVQRVIGVAHQGGFDVFRIETAEIQPLEVAWEDMKLSVPPQAPHREREVHSILFQPGDKQKRMLTVGADREAHVWEVAPARGTVRYLSSAKGHDGPIGYAAWSASSERYLTVDEGATHVWHASGNPHLPHVGPLRGVVTAVEILGDASRFWYATREESRTDPQTGERYPMATLHCCDFRVGEAYPESWSHRTDPGSYVVALFHWSERDELIAVYSNGLLGIRDAQQEDAFPVRWIELGHSLARARVHEAEGIVSLVTKGGEALILDLTGDDPRPETIPAPGRVQSLAVAPGGRRIAVGTQDGWLALYDRDTGPITEVGPLGLGDPSRQEILGLAFHPTRAELVSSGPGNELAFWDLELNAVEKFPTPGVPAGPVWYCSDGERLLHHGKWMRDLFRFDRATQDSVRFGRDRHVGALSAVAVDATAGRVLTVCEDGKAKYWDIESGEVQLTFGGHQGKVTCGAISDGEQAWAITGDSHGVVRVWPLNPVAVAGNALPRGFLARDEDFIDPMRSARER